jgi:integrase/recombinase XerD
MKAKNYSVNLHWDKRYPKVGTSECPVQLAVNINGLQFKISLKIYTTQSVYQSALNSRGGGDQLKELRRQINEYVTKAEKILDRLPNPSRETFQRLFKSETDLFSSNKTDITLLFEEYAIQLRKEERIKSAINLDSSLTSLKKYKQTIHFEDINEAWLKGYKAWMTKKGNSSTTTQIYLRNLRTIFNKAIKDGYISSRFYPFKDYKIGSSAKSKNVLYAPQLKALWDYEGRIMRETRSKDMFFMCYLTNGCNFKDIAYLTWKDIKGDTLSFVREKTKRTNTSEKQITVHMHDEIKRIIETWGNTSRSPDDYVFPILTNKMTAVQKEKRRGTFQRLCNKMLNIIGKNLEFEISLSLNLARHSFATTLKLSGTPTSFISDSLGHASGKTTEHYLKSLPTDKVREISNTLLNFNEPQQ